MPASSKINDLAELLNLVPAPRRIRRLPRLALLRWPKPSRISVDFRNSEPSERQMIRRILAPHSIQCVTNGRHAFQITLSRDSLLSAPKRVRDQAYRIRLSDSLAEVTAEGRAGLQYAFTTLRRVIRAAGERPIPAVEILDWPDYPVRGLLLDISRDKVPTLKTMRTQIARWADWKINQVQLYTEHTFAYAGHETVWRGASPLTATQVRSLDRLCRNHGIELVPNQNSLGHMERWLKHRRYAPLAECNGPYQTPWGETRTRPTTLNPLDPRSLRLVASLYRQLLPNFSSRLLNVGCDEPFELGQGRSRLESQRRGPGQVYLDWLLRIRREAAKQGRRIQFWSDWIQREPAALCRLPKDVMPLVWGYEADHPFNVECARLARLGFEFYVCPGTSSWCSIAGRTRNMMANVRSAASAGVQYGASGLLMTDWGDFGHRQCLPVSYPGYLLAAVTAWCARTNRPENIAAWLSREVFCDATGRMAKAWLEAGRVHEDAGAQLKNRTILFSIMQTPLADLTFFKTLRFDRLARAGERIASIRRRAQSARPRCADAALVKQEFSLTLDVLAHACRRGLFAIELHSGSARHEDAARLLAEIRYISMRHSRLWRARNRLGGLRDSLGHYRFLMDDYRRWLTSL